jgi:hypothetical protein
MRKMAMAILAALAVAGCAGMRSLPPSQLTVQKIIEAPGLTKLQIFNRSTLWIVRNFKPFKAVWLFGDRTSPVLGYANEQEGILIATGNIFYPNRSYSLTEGYKRYWEITFTMEEDIKDGKARVTFRNLSIYVPKLWCGNIYSEWLGAYDKALTEADDMAAVSPALLSLADQLGEFLLTPQSEENW